MPDIYHSVPISSDADSVFECVSTSDGLSRWWSIGGSGVAGAGSEFSLDFGPEYQWKAVVENFEPERLFSIKMTEADSDWTGTVITFELEESESGTMLKFEHLGWPEDNQHYRISSYCWAMYLRCLKNYLEKGIELPYEQRFAGE